MKTIYQVICVCDRALSILLETMNYQEALDCLRADFLKTSGMDEEELGKYIKEKSEDEDKDFSFASDAAWSNLHGLDVDWVIHTVDLGVTEESFKPGKYQINLFYAWEDGEDGIYHAFEATDPNMEANTDRIKKKLAALLYLKPDDENFNIKNMNIDLSDSLVECIKAAGVREYLANQKEKTK